MDAIVIRFSDHERRASTPRPAEPATLLYLRHDRTAVPKPKRRRTRHLEDDERQAEPIGPGDQEDGKTRR